MKTLPFVVFVFLIASAVLSSLGSAQLKARSIEDDVEAALSQALAERQSNVVDADTIRVYRSYISIPEVRDTASISVKTIQCNNQDIAVLEAKAKPRLDALSSPSLPCPTNVLLVF